MNIVLLGGPGSGKGTQATALSGVLGVPHVSSGDLFREHLEQQTDLGKLANSFISQGELVPDEVTIAMIRERLAEADCRQGVLLDGFPRTIPQAKALEEILHERKLDLVILIEVSPDVLLKRLSGRWICKQCGFVYNQYFGPPKVDKQCDACGGKLEQRADDRPAVQRRRIQVYAVQTAPLIAYYRERGLLIEVDGEQDVEGVQSQILAAIASISSSA